MFVKPTIESTREGVLEMKRNYNVYKNEIKELKRLLSQQGGKPDMKLDSSIDN